MEFFHKVTRFPFMNTRKVWYGLSALLIVASIGLVVLRGLNLGVDFTGGVVVDTNFPQAPNIELLRTALVKSGVANGQVQAFGSSRDIRVRLPPDPNAKGDQIGAHILQTFETVSPGVKLQSTEVVGPQVGQELFVKGGWALFATLVLILIYVLFRFTLKLACGAILAVLHDPIYREKYAQNLKREFPRIPFYPDFWRWSCWGERLMALHIGYESVEQRHQPFAPT